MKEWIRIVALLLFLSGCNQDGEKRLEDKPDAGTIHMSIDESFRPAMEEQIHLFELTNPRANLVATYKPESDCFRDFFKDSNNRMIVVSRGLSRKEEKFMMDSLGYNPACQPIAYDAVAIIVNKQQQDTLFTLDILKQLLQGKLKEKTAVFDGLKATSTVRFIRDSILKGDDFDLNAVRAAKSSKEVIEYVASNANAVGFIGFSWIGNPEDSVQTNELKKVKLAYVRCDQCEQQPFVKPFQQNLLTRRYPLVRTLYYILKENYSGLGTGFTSYLKFERGQLVFRRAYLGPVMDLDIRAVKINERIPSK